jgi:long-subunit fatty acid transport protein
MFRRALLAAVIALITGAAQASAWGANTVTITEYHTTTAGILYLITSANENPDGCTTHASLLVNGDTMYKMVIATIIAAQTSQQTVQLYYDGCSGGYPVISSVAVPHL